MNVHKRDPRLETLKMFFINVAKFNEKAQACDAQKKYKCRQNGMFHTKSKYEPSHSSHIKHYGYHPERGRKDTGQTT